jgi:2-(1,2-epoxy-1,2-dihydrophenyl)acetyl-CoA isomerase
MEEPVRVEITGGIARLVLNRPKAYNSFNLETIGLMAQRLIELAGDRKVEGLLITGEGKAFCAGGDLRWASQFGRSYGEAFHELAARYHQAILEIRRMPKPVTAAINGLAAGGGFSLALACDFRVMARSAVFKQAYTSNGLSMDGGGTFNLPRLVGLARAMEIAAFDRPISSEQAMAWGLVNEVVDDGRSVERALEMLKELRTGSLSSFAASKKLMTDSFNASFESQLENERALLSWCADHPNGREGIAAFLEKRRPVYNSPDSID